ncbi:hypothetical protein [Streptomyces sp. NPDC020917]|uniref:hypothetical protein n=1 Tax=Streptomyces sp. NPDC020917 TaxID=3365102 RepID=UPI0037952FD1
MNASAKTAGADAATLPGEGPAATAEGAGAAGTDAPAAYVPEEGTAASARTAGPEKAQPENRDGEDAPSGGERAAGAEPQRHGSAAPVAAEAASSSSVSSVPAADPPTPLTGLPALTSAGLPLALAAHLPRVADRPESAYLPGSASRPGSVRLAGLPTGDADPSGGPCGPDRPGEPAATREVLRRNGMTLTCDGSYAACLAEADGGWFAERWTLGGPETYSVPLPGAQPEEPGTPVAPLPDGRVLVLRRVADRYDAVLLSPTGPATGELPLGSLTADEVRLLPPSPVPGTAFVLACTGGASTVWQVLGTGEAAPVPVMTVPGRCTGGVWLDRAGRLLALDCELDGRAKAVAADLHTGTVSPLLQLTDDSDDRLVLAEPDSGLLLLRSDAAGESRLGWGVLGSARPVRFPDALCVPGLQFGPVAAQPGQILSPESVVVALRAEAPGGAESLALWRPGERRVHWRAAPAGWLSGAGLWLPGTDLRLPYAAPEPGLMRYDTPPVEPAAPAAVVPRVVREPGRPKPVRRSAAVLPLQQAPLAASASRSTA